MKHLTDFLSYLLNTRQYSARTAEAYAFSVEQFGRLTGVLDPGDAVTKDFDTYMNRLHLAVPKLSASTKRLRLYAVKRFFRWLYDRGFISANPAAVIEPPTHLRDVPTTFTPAEILLLLNREPPPAPSRRSKKGSEIEDAKRRIATELRPTRDTVLLALIYEGALRASEVGRLRLVDLVFPEKGPPMLYFAGKGNRRDAMAVGPWLSRLLQMYVSRLRLLRIEHPALFPPLWGRKGRSNPAGVSADLVRKILLERVKFAGIEPGRRKVSPHILRRSRITHVHDKGILSSYQLTAFARHSDPKTTMAYIGMGGLAKISGLAQSALPWSTIPLFPGTAPDTLERE